MQKIKKSGNTLVVSAYGFTLIEVLLVIAILAILAAVVIIALNPAKQLAEARDTQRSSDVFSILNALYQYSLDNEGAFPAEITTDGREVCATSSDTCDELDLSELTDEEKYLVSIPLDPQCAHGNSDCTENGTGYYVNRTENGRMTVSAYGAETSEIVVTR